MKAPRLAAALVAPLLLLAACGDDDGDAVVEAGGEEMALARLQAAPEAVAQAGSARMEMTMTMEAMGQRFEITAEGGYAGDRSILTMDMGAMVADLAEESGEVMPPGFDEPMTIVTDGTTTYMKVPMLAMFTGTDGWLSVSAEDLGMNADDLGLGMASNDPTQMVESLRGVSDDIEELGTEKVRGVDATRYRVVVDLQKAAAELDGEAREAYEQEMADFGVDSMPLEVWVGDDGLIYRMSIDLAEIVEQVDDEEIEELDSGSMVVEFFDYGSDLDIEVPDASEVTPLSEVMGGFGFDPESLTAG